MESAGSLDKGLEQIKTIAQTALRQILEENRKKWESEIQGKQHSLLKHINPDFIRLNVGGKKFVTTLATLQNIKNNKLDKMATGRYPIMLDNKQRIFIDRNGEYFGYVLDCLRSGKVEHPKGGPLEKRITTELEFFGLLNSKEDDFQIGSTGSNTQAGSFAWKFSAAWSLKTSTEKTKIETTDNSPSGHTVGDKELKSGTHEWSFSGSQIADPYGSFYCLFGILPTNKVSLAKQSGAESYCYGFSLDGDVVKGDLGDVVDVEELSPFAPLNISKQVHLTLNVDDGLFQLSAEDTIGSKVSRTITVPAGQGYYPYFHLNSGHITLSKAT